MVREYISCFANDMIMCVVVMLSLLSGPLPMPTVWVSFVNVLYISDCDVWSGTAVAQFMQKWMNKHEDETIKDRDIYLAGNLDDERGGKFLFSVASAMTKVYNVAGVVAANSKHTPIMRFGAHRSFETLNKMTDYTINRARQDIICNGFYSGVDFIMNDVLLHYIPKDDSTIYPSDRNANFEYKLDFASSGGMCYNDIDEFDKVWSSRQLPHGFSTNPQVKSSDLSAEYNESCESSMSKNNEDGNEIVDAQLFADIILKLLENNVKIVLYNYVQKSSNAICNFYIGIYESDSSYYRVFDSYNSSVLRTIKNFNDATLDEMDAVWSSHTSSSGSTIAWLQDGLYKSINEEGGIVWIQLDDRFVKYDDVKGGRSEKPLFGYLTKATAVEILAHVLGKHQDTSTEDGQRQVIDFVDLLI